MIRVFALVLGVAIALSCDAAEPSPPYPNKPVRLVVPAPPGGTIDPISRMLAEALSKRYGQNVVVDNRPGANFNVGMALVAKSEQFVKYLDSEIRKWGEVVRVSGAKLD